MKKTILLLALTGLLCRCSVQQFAVNTNTQPFANGGMVFGEKTRGQEFKKKRDFFVLGINVYAANTPQMAKELNATSYTIESKSNLFTYLTRYFTFGVVNYKVVKVIKRNN